MPTVTIGDNTGNTYAGCNAIHIDQGSPTVNTGWDSAARCKLTGSSEEQTPIVFVTLPGAIVGPVTVSAATLYLYKENAGDDTAKLHGIYEILRTPVYADVTWNEYSSGNSWGTAGALNTTTDINGTALDTSNSLNGAGYESWTSASLAALIESKINAAASGFYLKVREIGDNGRVDFRIASSADGTRPYVEFTYAVAGGPPVICWFGV